MRYVNTDWIILAIILAIVAAVGYPVGKAVMAADWRPLIGVTVACAIGLGLAAMFRRKSLSDGRSGTEHFYSLAERREQITQLAPALDRLIAAAAPVPDLDAYTMRYRAMLKTAHACLAAGFTEEQARQLGKDFAHPFHYDKDFSPPTEILPGGRTDTAAWYPAFDAALQPVARLCANLSALGYLE